MKDLADTSVPTEFLFGQDLAEKLNSVKALESVSKELKLPSARPPAPVKQVSKICNAPPRNVQITIFRKREFKLPQPGSSPRGDGASKGSTLQSLLPSEDSSGENTREGEKAIAQLCRPSKIFFDHWLPLTNNPVIISWIRGYRLPFTSKPSSQHQPPFYKAKNLVEHNQMQAEINHLLQLDAVRVCKAHPDQFLSNIFLASKPNGKKRFILNLKSLNIHIYAPHFKMEDARTASKLIQHGNYAATIDLKDAYYLVPIHKDDRKYLRFYFNCTYYEFTCVAFGLASAPFMFTKLMKPIVRCLRDRDVLCVNYLDDFLILGQTKEICESHLRIATTLLTSLGFLINTEKSILSPNTRCKFLGFIFDSNTMSIELPPEKREKILLWVKFFLSHTTCRILKFAQFLGLLTSACPAIKYGWRLERAKFLALRSAGGNYNAFMSIPRSLLPDLNWWITNIRTSKNDLRRDVYDLEICTDASLSGWGACCRDDSIHGWWSLSESSNHINFLELQAIFFGLQCFANNLQNCNILIRTDNTTALANVNRMGSVKHQLLNSLTRNIWHWAEERNIWIFASYISSSENWQADLNDQVFLHITQSFGSPDIDIFASRNNHKCARYISWLKDPGAEAVDAFTIDWGNIFFYAFPPFSQILRTLQKIKNDKAEGILVVPYWKSQSWYPLFNTLTIDEPLQFGPSREETPSTHEPYPGCSEVIREAFRRKGIPAEAIGTMLRSLSENTIKQYATTYKRWWQYCQEKGISPFDASIPQIISFFQTLIDSARNTYNSFNTHRSAISLISSKDLGSNPQIKRFIKGIFRMRPPKPKYSYMWDPQQVLNHLQSSPASHLKFLSYKLVTLLALTTGERIHTLSLIKCSNIVFSSTGVTIAIPDFTKTSRPQFRQPRLFLPYFPENCNLCVASTLQDYLNVTRTLRQTNCDSLFLSYKKPHAAASKQTISRWVKNTLNEAGVDTSTFTAHSTRHASTSCALRGGVSVDIIRKSAGWSENSSTFAKWYNLPLIEPKDFCTAVLNIAPS
ncbi:hypothetical protein NQ315_000109 [Exocentrus adspersus]|uniref:Reverse transcriptase domain-containing protein n=1 Tax=Exocentrus adspersus TaxID=1586481 RepID=A0AAV8VT99_9CUCU|nr:hypothetical protein NQ315_000109 [Exocentrus adspersus]